MGSLNHASKAALLCCAAALTLPMAAGCSGESKAAGSGDREGTPAGLDELAVRTGCALSGQRKAQELQQGNCKNSRGQYVLVSFTTDKGLNSWMEEAKPWGGTYLVGTRWVAVSTPATLQSLQKDLGGRVVSGETHGMGDMPGMKHG
ncbi:hypothetical protein [Actinomadura rubrisoli]|uniref:Lipoprotein n=1 Tax=Actinomadura rubrisoli TaxID=2530368 RepID=A0A4R5BE03_9ACTN|nr:hypothetical protein [Actinomadura rubrisoli]TDD83026.1 hypothetical protein E1298_21815 [Actinomadura rubrisoli]